LRTLPPNEVVRTETPDNRHTRRANNAASSQLKPYAHTTRNEQYYEHIY
jgi:hypothetical protein